VEWQETGIPGAICYQIATKKPSGSKGAEPWGAQPELSLVRDVNPRGLEFSLTASRRCPG
jgi:hypothetical protein